MRKEIKEMKGLLKEFLINGTQNISRMEFYKRFSEFVEQIELKGGGR